MSVSSPTVALSLISARLSRIGTRTTHEEGNFAAKKRDEFVTTVKADRAVVLDMCEVGGLGSSLLFN